MLRVLATPRWVGWSLLALVVVAGCGAMAYWQLLRAESPTGSLLNAGYAFQWPLFGIFFAVLWWRMLRGEARALAELVDRDDEPAGAAPEVPDVPAAASVPLASGAGSPFTARPAGVSAGGLDTAPAPGSARAEYNAMLVALAAEDRASDGARDADTNRQEDRRP